MGYAEYRTIAGVSGPLVVAEGVKVSRHRSHLQQMLVTHGALALSSFVLVGCCCCLQKPMYAEIVEVRLGDGTIRRGQVLEVDGNRAVVQVQCCLPGAQTAEVTSKKSIQLGDFHQHEQQGICVKGSLNKALSAALSSLVDWRCCRHSLHCLCCSGV